MASASETKFTTWDDCPALGMEAPSLDSVTWVTGEDVPRPTADTAVTVLFFWGKYHKPGYKFCPLYSALNDKFKDVCFVGASTDPDETYAAKFLADPDGKYAKGPFTTNFAICHDKDKKMVTHITSICKKTVFTYAVGIPSVFVIAGGKVVWTQDHSELGATASTYIEQVTEQIQNAVDGKDMIKNGPNPVVKDDEDESSSEEEGDGAGGDYDPLADL